MRDSGTIFSDSKLKVNLLEIDSMGECTSARIQRGLVTPPETRFKPFPGPLGRRRPAGSRSKEAYPTPHEKCHAQTAAATIEVNSNVIPATAGTT